MAASLTSLLVAFTLTASPLAEASPLDHVRTLLRGGHHEAAVGILVTLLPTLEDEQQRAQAQYLLGKHLTERGDPGGLIHLEALPKPFGRTEDRRLVWLARARSLAKPDLGALKALDAALKLDLHASEAAALRDLRADVRESLTPAEAGRVHPELLADLVAIEKSSASRHDRAAALLRRARLLEAAGHRDATAAWRALILRYPDTHAARQDGLGLNVSDLTSAERMKRVRVLVRHFVYGQARDELRPFLDDKRHRYEARWLTGLIGIRKLRDNPAQAREMMKWVIRMGGEHREEAYYLLARTYLKEDRYEEAADVFRRYERRYPRGQYREASAYYRAFMPYDERKCREAMPLLRQYIASFGRRRHTSKGFLAWCHIRIEDWSGAIKAFDALIPGGGPLGRGKAYYWQAYALDKLGKRDRAIRLLRKLRSEYPLTWYDIHGQRLLASWEGRSLKASELPWPDGGGDLAERFPLHEEPWSWPRLRGGTRRTFERVEQLVRLGEIDLARRAYKSIRSRVEGAVPSSRRTSFVQLMSHRVEDYKHSWKTVSGGRLSAMMPMPTRPGVEWATLYPLAYGSLVSSRSPEFSIPPWFVYAIMRQESRYHPAMISSMDAIGALQMIPQTAILVGEDMGTPYDAKTFPDPRVGFPFTFRYMQMHDELWKGQWALTAASYNAGPAPIRRWLRENPGVGQEFLVEEFSYSEARAYTRRVAEHMTRYLYLYVSDPEERGRLLDGLFPVTVNHDISEDVGF